jgi:predicted DNA repair protein MutK
MAAWTAVMVGARVTGRAFTIIMHLFILVGILLVVVVGSSFLVLMLATSVWRPFTMRHSLSTTEEPITPTPRAERLVGTLVISVVLGLVLGLVVVVLIESRMLGALLFQAGDEIPKRCRLIHVGN